ncbi:hypothetical protein [Bacteroidetes bacterium endosymbiont of Geopemphigus sp.]|nr:hypothetical protein [Bacteroidetes bacterium endosymbiont of Geopemphigus sp.]
MNHWRKFFFKFSLEDKIIATSGKYRKFKEDKKNEKNIRPYHKP